jgi:hypothetical protein
MLEIFGKHNIFLESFCGTFLSYREQGSNLPSGKYTNQSTSVASMSMVRLRV